MRLMLLFVLVAYTGIKSFSFLCWMLRIVGQKVSTKPLMAALSDCSPSSSCLLLREYLTIRLRARADSQRGAAELTIARRKRGRVV